MSRLSDISCVAILLIAGCGDSTAAPSRPAHLDPPPVPREHVTNDPQVRRLALPSDWAEGDKPVVLPTVAIGEKVIVRWQPPEPENGEPLRVLPTTIFRILRVRPDERPVTMNSKGFKGQKLVPGMDACEVEIEAPQKAGEYVLEAKNRDNSIVSQAILNVTAVRK